jgi:hypothetical protein
MVRQHVGRFEAEVFTDDHEVPFFATVRVMP